MSEVTTEEEAIVTTPKTNEPFTYRYPENLGSDSNNKTYIRFTIKDRLDLKSKKSIYLYCPPGLSVADGAGYGQLDMGTLGGLVDEAQKQVAADGTGGGSFLEQAGALGGSLYTVGQKQMKSAAQVLGGKMGKGVGQQFSMKSGTAQNMFTVAQFSGVTQRSFQFSFKLVAESTDQAKLLKEIENTFRKFLYPSTGEGRLALKYPPYWQIEFYHKGGVQNKHLPFINLSYLQSMTATYNQSTNAFHEDGRPLEVDISLAFIESKNMTREDLYTNNDYNDAEYTYNYVGSSEVIDVSGNIDAGLEVVEDWEG